MNTIEGKIYELPLSIDERLELIHKANCGLWLVLQHNALKDPSNFMANSKFAPVMELAISVSHRLAHEDITDNEEFELIIRTINELMIISAECLPSPEELMQRILSRPIKPTWDDLPKFVTILEIPLNNRQNQN